MERETISESSTVDLQNTISNELEHLEELAGINVWGHDQAVLEQQALIELDIFNKSNQTQKEDGELSDNEPQAVSKKSEQTSLDINSYIKRQEELKKRQDHKKTLSVSKKSLEVANIISRKQGKEILKSKRKVNGEEKRVQKRLKRNYDKLETVDIACNNDNSAEVRSQLNDTIGDKDEDLSGSDYIPSEPDSDYEPGYMSECEQNVVKTRGKRTPRIKTSNKVVDDGSSKAYKHRLEKYYQDLEKEQKELVTFGKSVEDFVEVKPGFKILAKIWNNLYSYQQDGIVWLWNLHEKSTGGLLGDEMGLGKTVQIIAFLFAVNYSRPVSNHGRYTGLGPSIIVCPSTVVHQWVKHFHLWAPEFRVVVLHSSGSYSGNKIQLIKDMNKNKAIIITTYQTILKYKRYLTELDWHYIILDEGHKIRNHGAKISIAVKEFNTPHRLLLTGSPMQNNLQELWSLFDFINTGMLGTLPVFLEHFASPIMQGGYSNASPMQEALALSMATALKNMITPYMLRRSKNEVQEDICLPNKSEQVLFCSLTQEQRDLYKGYLMGEQVTTILGRGSKNWFSENYTRCNVLIGITTLRKICNHPDIYLNAGDGDNEDTTNNQELDDSSNFYKRSGKMVVVSALLKIWKKQNHRVLLFTQSRAMIKIFEQFLRQQGYKYLKMDGGTAITSRQLLIDKFNQDSSYDVFVLTTRVGGLGVNLTGANRVIIYDPDWNPATDTQARERAWRIGQEKQVTIYRLISAGTIEEKMYQRQVWKQLLSNKVLQDPKTQKFFKTSDLHDLFSLQDDTSVNPETANIFQNSRISLEKKLKEKKQAKTNINFTDDKIEKMKQLAAQIAKNISHNNQKKEPDKTLDQLELEQERAKKMKEKALLKTMSVSELMHYNREKSLYKEEPTNKIDDCDTEVSFTKALIISEKTADLYNKTKSDKKNVEAAINEYCTLTKVFANDKGNKKRHKSKDKNIVDKSGEIDGEKVDGLVKLEIKKHKRSKRKSESQDDYVLNKLFSKNGIHSALQHDTIVQSGTSHHNSIKIRSETQLKTDMALQALSKSRLKKWRW